MELSGKFPVNLLCEKIGIPRSSFYNWKKGVDEPSEQKKRLFRNIALFREYHNRFPSHGYRWLNAKIKLDLGIVLSGPYAHKCCKIAGIKSVSKHYKYKKPGDPFKTFPNLLLAGVNINGPMECVVSDMTAFYVKGIYYELTLYMDLWNDELIAHSLSSKRGDRMTYLNGLQDVIEYQKQHPGQELILHSDQGSVYASKIPIRNSSFTAIRDLCTHPRAITSFFLCTILPVPCPGLALPQIMRPWNLLTVGLRPKCSLTSTSRIVIMCRNRSMNTSVSSTRSALLILLVILLRSSTESSSLRTIDVLRSGTRGINPATEQRLAPWRVLKEMLQSPSRRSGQILMFLSLSPSAPLPSISFRFCQGVADRLYNLSLDLYVKYFSTSNFWFLCPVFVDKCTRLIFYPGVKYTGFFMGVG